MKRLWCVFWSVFGPFLVFGKEETCREELGREKLSEKCLCLLTWWVLWAIYRPRIVFRGGGHCRAFGLKLFWSGWSWLLWIDLYFQFLKMYGTKKSNDQIKSYCSRKFEVHRSVRHTSFHNILAVLTLILTYEQSLEWEFDDQWHWFLPVLAAGSKLGFLGLLEIDFEPNLLKTFEKLGFGVNLWKT